MSTPPGSAIITHLHDEGFEAAVLEGAFNAVDPGVRPDAVVRPRTEAGVVAAVRQAAAAGQRIAVRSGGHSWVASSVRDGGILIDLGELDGIRLHPESMTAVVGPAARGAQISPLLEAAGLAFPVGHCGDPGIGGFLLGGGLGVNWGGWKPSAFSIRSLRIVTADGEALTASATENPDLFWLARGSGPGFAGIVTSIELELRPLPGAIQVTTWRFPIDDLPTVSAWIVAASPRLPANVEVSLVTAGSQRPGGLGDDDPHPLVVGVAATVFAADEDEARAALAPLGDGPSATSGGALPRASGAVTVLDHLPPTFARLSELHVPVDATYPRGARYLADTFWFAGDLAEATKPLAALMRTAPSGRSYVLSGMPANGAGAQLLIPGEAAYGMHDTTLFIVYVVWDDPADDAANRAWLDEVAEALLPTSTGHFLSEADIRAHPERVQGCFRAVDWSRIQQLTHRYDPAGLFHGFPTARPPER
ncbi:FAD-binding protein [Herbiconiux sp.]|uniref:FAD-binding oxidoreductase n=1 Tax=Herbiconiux sp. TaxID=1871186 RepID=UPI0025BA2965|nr:FAD-binding protein [Herbiconiux sp.]